jgi:hypothetical protein
VELDLRLLKEQAAFHLSSDASNQATDLVPPGTPHFVSYLYNDYLTHWGWGVTNPAQANPFTMAAIVAPADQIVITEGGLWATTKPFIGEDNGCSITGAKKPKKVRLDAWHGLLQSECQPRHEAGSLSQRRRELRVRGRTRQVVQGHQRRRATKVSIIQDVLPWEKHMNPEQTYAAAPTGPDARQWQ